MRPAVILILLGGIAFPWVSRADTGIAARYPGDVGLESDPRVLLVENFEVGTLDQLRTRWNDVRNLTAMAFTSDRPGASAGARALKMTAVGGSHSGGHLYKPLSKEVDRVYLRYYVKYESSGSYSHTSGWIGGYHPITSWPQGGAGSRPAGNERFSVGAEPVTRDLRFDFYAYWMDMRGSGGAFWGNDLINDPNLRTPVDKWTCVEVMIKLNDVSSANGELALWLDGKKITHLGPGFPNGGWIGGSFHQDPSGSPFEGFEWRSDANLQVNWIWLNHYAPDVQAGSVSAVSWDDLVVATEYIGPISEGQAPLGPPGRPELVLP